MKSKKIGVKFIVLLAVCVVSGIAFGVDKPNTETDTCVTEECHVSFGKKKVIHGPVELGDCESCHESVNTAKHTWKMAEEGSELCSSCHDDILDKANVHEPAKEGDCSMCHDPHSSDHKFLLPSSKTSDVCQECHTITEGMSHLHGPVAVGQCSVCHSAHSSNNKHLLSVEPEKVCISCHTTTQKEMEKFEFIHEAAKGQCFGCHDPHGADNWKMLRDKAPAMCYSCHEDIKKRAETSIHKHGVIKKDGSCLLCHTPHASTVKYILKDAPTKLCLTCHDKPLGVTQDDIIPSFTEQIEGKKFMHGPIKDKDCAGCHKTHGSDHFRMLDKEYPAMFYAPFDKENYALCFGCHEDTVVLNERTRRLTDFRNGDLNLHFLHVNKDRRGRTCRACHQTHASNNPKHIRESVPYGSWSMPVGFTKTETGGTCAPGCHVAKDYDRIKAVDYTAKSHPSKDVVEDNPLAGTEPAKPKRAVPVR